MGQVFLAAGCVIAATLGAFAAAVAGWRRRNWIAGVFAFGAALVAAGVAGQRSFPSASAVQRLGAAAARTSAPGPFDAGVTIPVVNLQITPVTLAGILIAALGLSLLLVFEPSQPPAAGPVLRPLHDEDAV